MIDLGLNLGKGLFGFHQETKKADRINRARLIKYKIYEHKYHRDYTDRVIGWKNTNLDDAIEVDNKYKESLGQLAESKLKVWQSIKQGTVAEQEAFAAMMSVGGGEQTGARSGSSTSRREAVMAYGQAMNKIAIAKSSTRDNEALFSSNVRDAFAGLAHAKDIKSGTSRPTYGPADRFEGFVDRPDPWTFAIDQAIPTLGSFRKYDKLKAPESAAETTDYSFNSTESLFGSNYDMGDTGTQFNVPWKESSEMSSVPFISEDLIGHSLRADADKSLGSSFNIPFVP